MEWFQILFIFGINNLELYAVLYGIALALFSKRNLQFIVVTDEKWWNCVDILWKDGTYYLWLLIRKHHISCKYITCIDTFKFEVLR